MIDLRIAAERMQRQRLTRPGAADAAELVGWFGAVQAQEYGAAKWALALRMRGRITDAEIERAFNEGRILRTHLLRPTWHFVSAQDIGWLLELTAPRIHRALGFGQKYFGLTPDLNRRGGRVIARALEREECLTRPELADRLARAGVAAKGTTLALMVIYAELEGVVCSGPRRGKHSTYMLLERRAPRARTYGRDEALGELTTRYVQSHGPATVRDLSWWSGLTIADAKRGLEIAGARSVAAGGLTYWTLGERRTMADARDRVHLLPVYDEYLVAYRDLEAVPRGRAIWGLLPPAIVSGGEVIGTWKAGRTAAAPVIKTTLGRKLTAAERRGLDEAIARYRGFSQYNVDRKNSRMAPA